MVLDISQDEIDQIWNDANILYDSMQENIIEISNNNECKHTNIAFDSISNENICEHCGLVVSIGDSISQEWNNYKDDSGCLSKNTQRGEVWISDNPYDKHGTIMGTGKFINKNSFIYKLQQQLCFNHKQKNVWQVKNLYEHISVLLGHKRDVVSTANLLWCACVDANILTRAEVRTGLIAICYYYACLENNIVIERSNISKYFECKNISKGEKIFCSIMENVPTFRNITQMKIDPSENRSFFFYCNKLGLDYKFATECDNNFNSLKNKLKGITPKSIIAGIIAYVAKDVYSLKSPSKKEISQVVSVCIPTINKVIALIKQ